MNTLQAESTEQFLSGGGEMGKLIRSMDWSKTALGPIEQWPQSLRTSVSLCLSSTFPILIAWGPETIQIYNDSYRPICGAKHPESMGQNFRICWETALPVVGDAFDRGQQGEGTYITDQRMFLDRYGYLEEAFMTFSFAPIRDESGGVGGIFHPITESTDKMLGARRTQVLRDLGAALGKAKSVHEIGRITTEKYAEYVLDLPFMMLYQLDAETNTAQLVSAAGLETGSALTPQTINLNQTDNSWPLAHVLHTGLIEECAELQARFGNFSCEPYPETPVSAMLLPVKITGQTELFGFLVAGVSARRALDREYLNFYDLLANTYNTAVSNVYAYEQEQKRAEALAEIDRSKTAFFSNVSHEFRTPLTLMLGPLEDLLNRENLPPDVKAPVEATHRNALRLLKLVNNLLDYSRVEAGRVQAAYQPLDLCELTVDLASSFRSIIEKADMALEVECQPLKDTMYVDRQMWEKIVLNLLSNAFKYTLQGGIRVTLMQQGNFAVLKVHDTGVGIPEKELPHMFERFHRVENSAGRTHEGTGIGLSLVHELVQLHSGTISVESKGGEGSTFTIKIPTGKAHLQAEQVIETQKSIDSSALKGAFIKEAFSLLENQIGFEPENTMTAAGDLSTQQDLTFNENTHILIVDDNADMRAYLTRLLEPYFSIQSARNGKEALNVLSHHQPDLILSDMMMPVMDGKALLHAIRNNPTTARLPVIFLSARAGEEARIDGLEAGADDYLVKPFSAAELLTKIRAQIKISKARSYAEQTLRDLLMNAPVAIALYRGPNHHIELANDRMLEYWGRSAEETYYKPLFEAIPELETQGFDQIMEQVYKTGERFVNNEIPVNLTRYGNQQTTQISLTVEPLKEEEGIVSGMIAVASDVTEQVNARKEIEKISNTLKLAMEAAEMGTWKTEWGSDVLEVSERARKIHGIPLNNQLFFNETLEVIVPEHRERFLNAILHAVETKGRFNEDYRIQPFDGSKPKWINSTGMVELDDEGEVKSVIGTIMDITEFKEDELRKNDFIGMVSHELKTPLTSLSGYLQMLQVKAVKTADAFTANALDKSVNQVKKMTVMINGFLNVSRFESGKIQVNKQLFVLDQLLKEIVEEAELIQSTHTITYLPCEQATVNADRDKIGSVISNLLSNAIKYSPKGQHVEIKCQIVDSMIQVSVKDDGLGIKPDDIEKLFDRYYRVDSKHTENIAGFGIGLYLSAEIIERHNGKIWAESELGIGSTFYFSLPLD